MPTQISGLPTQIDQLYSAFWVFHISRICFIRPVKISWLKLISNVVIASGFEYELWACIY